MAKKSKLLLALDAQKGRDYDAEKRKKQIKAAEKKKAQKSQSTTDAPQLNGASKLNGHSKSKKQPEAPEAEDDDFEDFEDAGSENEVEDENTNGTIPQPDIPAEASASEAEQDSDVALSDLEESDREDVVPHQRMTINNTTALIASRKRIAVVSDKIKPLNFSAHNSLVSTDKIADELIPDAMDDETRELMFYKIARDATITARGLLKKEKVPFSRPADYFAEMVKTDEHMGKIKKKLYDEASSKKASEEARRLRDAKKFGKQVQIAKEQERAKEKKDTLNKIKELKRSKFSIMIISKTGTNITFRVERKDNDTGRVTEGDDLFQDINVENDDGKTRRDRATDKSKRQKKDDKFGFGGRKRFSKSGTAESSGDLRSFSAKRIKGKGKPTRPGKSRRVSARS